MAVHVDDAGHLPDEKKAKPMEHGISNKKEQKNNGSYIRRDGG